MFQYENTEKPTIMKKLLYIVLGIIFSTSLFSQQPSNEDLKKRGSFLRFEPLEINLGQIPNTNVTENTGNIEIKVFNDGVQPLIINQVTACCGTRVSEWTTQPIAPGQNGTVKVYFRVGTHPHRISRTVTVNSNAVNGAMQRVAILGEVVIPTQSNEIKLP